MERGWIGIDLDGTLATYDKWVSDMHIGEPIEPMVTRVQHWLAQGIEVKVFTARVGKASGREEYSVAEIKRRIREWTEEHIGTALDSTCCKDFAMIELWDDRAVQVVKNTGARADGQP